MYLDRYSRTWAVRSGIEKVESEKKEKEMSTKIPNTELGKRLIELRNRAIENGVVLLNADEINAEVAKNRGGSEKTESDCAEAIRDNK